MIKKIRLETELTQKDFAEYFNIPVRTLQDWEGGRRNPPTYLVELIEYKLKKERMNMKEIRYELKTSKTEVEYRKKEQLKEGASEERDPSPELIETFESKQEALEELKKYRTEIHLMQGATNKYYHITEYYVEEAHYDSDGEWIGGGDILEFSEFPTIED